MIPTHHVGGSQNYGKHKGSQHQGMLGLPTQVTKSLNVIKMPKGALSAETQTVEELQEGTNNTHPFLLRYQ